MSELIDIEKNVVMPELPKRGAVYPYEQMEVGDSFFVPTLRPSPTITPPMVLIVAGTTLNAPGKSNKSLYEPVLATVARPRLVNALFF